MEPGLEQISAVMLGGDSVEIKASVTMDVLVLNQVCGQVILNVREEPLDTERLKQIPGIVAMWYSRGFFVEDRQKIPYQCGCGHGRQRSYGSVHPAWR